MDAIALGLYVAFGAAAFGWRSWAQWRRTGDTGLRLHAEPGTVQWWAKLGFVAALIAGVVAPVAGLSGLAPLDALDREWVRGLGVLLALLGIGATLWSQWQMGASWRVGVDPSERTGLVTSGLFARVRNPIFTAMVLTAAGLALMVGNVVAVVGFVTLIAALQAQVRLVEEPYLRSVHGTGYDRYAAATGRFLPGVGRLRTTR
jgi:protein-S-isoprenylcysteine O-methyltransferase Ste14